MRIVKDRLAEEAVGLKQQFQKIRLSIKRIASLTSAELDRLRIEKTEAIREAIDLKKKLRVVDTMTENPRLTREREIDDFLKKEDGLTETIKSLRSQLLGRDLAMQTAESAAGSEIDTMRKEVTRYIDEVKTLKARLQAVDQCDNCDNERKMSRNGYDQAIKQVKDLKLLVKTAKVALESRSTAQKLREGHQSLMDQIHHIAKTVQEEAVDPKLPLDSEGPIPSPEILALNATISKQRKHIDDQSRCLTALHKRISANVVSADKELREGKMEDLYVQCVTDLAPVIIDLKQETFAKDRTIQNLRSNIASSMSQSRNSQHLISRMNETSPFGQSRNVHQSASFERKKDQASTPHARKQEEATLRLMREKRFQTPGR
jgi:hypothetical protein